MSDLTVTLTVEALEKLVRQKDNLQCWINRPQKRGVWQRAIRLTFDNYTFDTAEDPILVVEEIEGGVTMRATQVRVSELFDLAPNVQVIMARLAAREHF